MITLIHEVLTIFFSILIQMYLILSVSGAESNQRKILCIMTIVEARFFFLD